MVIDVVLPMFIGTLVSILGGYIAYSERQRGDRRRNWVVATGLALMVAGSIYGFGWFFGTSSLLLSLN
jgi:hypothetical protein